MFRFFPVCLFIHVCLSVWQQIKRVVEAGSFLRVLVDSGGCSGFQYKFELDTALHDDDRYY